jgi:hypothetical protein
MNNNLEIVQHFYSIEELERAVEILQDAGLTPWVDEEAKRTNSHGVYALEVPESQLERAEALLETEPSEEEGAMSMFADYERESEEVKEAYQQD